MKDFSVQIYLVCVQMVTVTEVYVMFLHISLCAFSFQLFIYHYSSFTNPGDHVRKRNTNLYFRKAIIVGFFCLF